MAKDNKITVCTNGVIVRSCNRKINVFKHPNNTGAFIVELFRVDGTNNKPDVITDIIRNRLKFTAFAISEESLDELAMAWLAYKREQGHVFEMYKDEQN